MLDTTLATAFVPGTNLKGEVPGANWIFLLPNLDKIWALSIGLPSLPALKTLAQNNRILLVVCFTIEQARNFRDLKEQYGFEKVSAVLANDLSRLPFSNYSFDLIIFAGKVSESSLDQGLASFDELRYLPKRGGLLYFEFSGWMNRILNEMNENPSLHRLRQFQLFWVTPLDGEIHTAVPLGDQETIVYFLDHKLYCPTVSRTILKHVKRPLQKHRLGGIPGHLAVPQKRPRSKVLPKKFEAMMRSAALNLIHKFERAERYLIRQNQSTSRVGLLIGGESGKRKNPPEYICSIASNSGIDIRDHYWGLSASGEYSSRKVLFFLFERTSVAQDGLGPKYIVKLVRDSTYNFRLENEQRALSLLSENGFGKRFPLPYAEFFGYHGDLAILGETFIGGPPFREVTDLTANCPYFHSAIDWFLELGATTVNLTAATSDQVAQGLGVLLQRFNEIYRISTKHRSFLLEQISRIAGSCDAFPLVFQHGDPGTWNAVVTPTGCIAFLDWEAAEPEGIPLWDLFYFLRSYMMGVARSKGIRDRIRAISQLFLTESPFSRSFVESTKSYCHQIELSEGLIEPLFYTCWMHRALKESTRLMPEKIDSGHYVNLLRLFIERRDTLMLNQLFS
jgi:hypothetical protein